VSLSAVCIDALDPARVATFWAGLLDREQVPDEDGFVLPSTEPLGFSIDIFPTQRPKSGPNRMHLDLTSTTRAAQQQTVDKALALGATHLDIGQGADAEHVVLADPEGNELCVIEPGNRFLAACGFLGALSCEGSREVGHFWSKALDWPLVWDQDGETAIQSPSGGPKISWGGPPVAPKTGKSRWHFDLVAPDQAAEVARLESLGARRTDIGQGDVSWVVMADPDGNELCVLASRPGLRPG
jgi:predicted enzyme related to lactoylglutathione lyase